MNTALSFAPPVPPRVPRLRLLRRAMGAEGCGLGLFASARTAPRMSNDVASADSAVHRRLEDWQDLKLGLLIPWEHTASTRRALAMKARFNRPPGTTSSFTSPVGSLAAISRRMVLGGFCRALVAGLAALLLGMNLVLAADGAVQLPTSGDIPPGFGVASFPIDASQPRIEGTALPDAPAIAAITEITMPGETLSVAGDRLDAATLRVWTDGLQFDINPLRSDSQRLQAVVPQNAGGKPVPTGVLFVWPIKGGHAGAPIRVNAPAAWWTWPAAVTPGMTEPLRVFGKNLAMPGSRPVVVLQSPAGGEAQRLEVVKAGSYELQVRVPARLDPGVHHLAIHNGTGNNLGWSHTLAVPAATPPRDPPLVIRVTPGPGDAVAKQLQTAIARAVREGGAVIELPAGAFELNERLMVPAGVPVVLRGAGMGQRAAGNFGLGHSSSSLQQSLAGGTVVFDHRSRNGETSFVELRGDGSRLENLTIIMRSLKGRRAVLLGGKHQSVHRVRLVNQSPALWDAALIESRGGEAAMHAITECEFIFLATAIKLVASHHVRIADCSFHGMYMMGRGVEANAIVNDGSSQMLLETSTFRSVDRTHGRVLGRTVLFKPHNIRNVYVHGNRNESVGSHSSVAGMEGNVSEQYLFHAFGSLSGDGNTDPIAVRAATADTLTVDIGRTLKLLQQRYEEQVDANRRDPSKQITLTEFGAREQWVVFISRGRGAGQWRVIAGLNPDGSLRLTQPWRVLPDATSRAVVDRANRQIAICGNLIDPAPDPSVIETTHKTVGVYYFFHTFDTVTAGNTMRNIGSGVGFATRRGQPCAWNTVRENIFENVTGTAGGTSYRPMFFNEHDRGVPTDLPLLDEWTSAGNVFRANRGRGADVAGLVGWLRYDIKDDAYAPRSESGLMLTVVENNEFTDVGRGLLLSAPANWTLLRHNRVQPRGEAKPVETLKPGRILNLLQLD